jgi:hypothetical protein
MTDINQNGFVKVIYLEVISISRWSLLICKGSEKTELCYVAQKCDNCDNIISVLLDAD